MRVAPSLFVFAVSLFSLSSSPLIAQTPAPATHPYTDPLGFSYAVPTGWEAVDTQASVSETKQSTTQTATSDAEKKGIACAQIGLTARHGDPASVIVLETLPFDCYGQQMSEADLSGFGSGAAEGIKQSFNVESPLTRNYTLGAHNFWSERVAGTPKGQPDRHYTVEIACTMLKKAAVCWLAIAADSASLDIFEQGAVTLEGDPSTALVPAGTFAAPQTKP